MLMDRIRLRSNLALNPSFAVDDASGTTAGKRRPVAFADRPASCMPAESSREFVVAGASQCVRPVSRLRSSREPWRLFLASQCLSAIGTWATRIAVAWLLYRLTRSVVWLGIAAFAGQIVVLMLSPLAAAVLDRCRRRQILLITQALFGVQALILFVVTVAQAATPAGIVCLGVLRGAVAAFDYPARQAFLSELTDGTDSLKQAIAFDGLQVNVARIAGPMLAGVLIVLLGESSCFFLDASSYLIALTGLGLIVDPAPPPSDGPTRARRPDYCWRWLRTQRALCVVLFLLATTSTLCLPFTVVLPQYVNEVLGEGPSTLGVLVALSGAGAIAATVLLWGLARLHISDRLCRWSGGAAGLCLACLGAADTHMPAFLLVTTLGFFIMLQISASAAFVQSVAPPDMRGRLAVVYSASFWGVAPFGSLLAGVAADWLGTGRSFIAAGMLCALAAVIAAICNFGSVKSNRGGRSYFDRINWGLTR
jgi:MFS family permease